MTVNECAEQVLRLLDEVGVTDYAQRMDRFIDQAQREIACKYGFIRKKTTLTAADGEAVALPADCYVVETVRGGTFEEEPMEDGSRGILLSGNADGRYTLIYKAYPDTIGNNDGAKVIQLAPEYHTALCARVAALTQDNEYDKRAYQLFMEMFNGEIAAIEYAKTKAGKARVVIYG